MLNHYMLSQYLMMKMMKNKKIEEVLKFDSNNRPKYNYNNTFDEKKFLDILAKIDLDALLIVHQKQTISSTSDPKQMMLIH